ncbi:hypothetical protein JCM3775_004391 [Rhodotorula graminis]
MASLLPATLDARTVSNLVEDLDRAFYPSPSSGFTARMLVLEALTVLCMFLAIFYLWLHYRHSPEVPKRRCLWLMRYVDRPSGRFLLINSRPIWCWTILFYTSYSIAFLAVCWTVYSRGIDQRAWIAMRAFNALFLFVCGWSFTFANLQAFFVAIESERVYVSARTANALFLIGGAIIIILELAVAIEATVFAEILWNRYLDLRGNLVALETALGGRVPTLVDFIPIAVPGEAFAAAAAAARMFVALVLLRQMRVLTLTACSHTIVQFSVVAIMPTAIIVTDLGGLALARRLKRRIEESDDWAPDALEPVQPGSSAVERDGPDEQPPTSSEQLQLGRGAANCPARGLSALEKVDGATVRVALARDHTKAAPTRAQTRARVTLQKAANELLATSLSTAFMAVSLLGVAICFACSAATGGLSSGKWAYVEAIVLPAQWLYTVAILVANVYMVLNVLRSTRRLTDLSTTAAPSECAGPIVIAHPPIDKVDERAGLESLASSSPGILTRDEPNAKCHVEPGAGESDTKPFFSRPPLLFSERPALLRRISSRSAWSDASSDGGDARSPVWRTRPAPPQSPGRLGGAIMVTVETVVVASGLDDDEDELSGWAHEPDVCVSLPSNPEGPPE